MVPELGLRQERHRRHDRLVFKRLVCRFDRISPEQPDGCEWLEQSGRLWAEAAARLQATLGRRGLSEKQHARWTAFFSGLSEWRPGALLSPAVEYVLKNSLAAWDAGQVDGPEVVAPARAELAALGAKATGP